MSKFKGPLAALAVVACAAAIAQGTDAPQLRAGDKWVYLVKSEQYGKETTLRKYESSLVRVTARNLVLAIRPRDSNLPGREEFLNPDWSKAISLEGQDTVVRKPFDFPLAPGKTWTVKYVADNFKPPVKFERDQLDYRVVGWEEVRVPAGTFKALKVEADGQWYREYREQGATVAGSITSDGAGTSASTVARRPFTLPPQTGRRYQAWWYVPELKREVKYLVESSRSDGTLGNRETGELDSFAPAP